MGVIYGLANIESVIKADVESVGMVLLDQSRSHPGNKLPKIRLLRTAQFVSRPIRSRCSLESLRLAQPQSPEKDGVNRFLDERIHTGTISWNYSLDA